MASASAGKSEKRLGEFLKEQQDPFILDAYLVERGYSKRWNNHISKSNIADSCKNLESSVNEKRKPLFPFSKLCTALHKKLSFHSQKSSTAAVTHSDNRIERVNDVAPPSEVGSFDHTIAETERFSSASSSTVFNSCSDIDEGGTCSSSQKSNQPSQQSQQGTNSGRHRQPLPQFPNDEILLNQQHDSGNIRSCGVLVPKKITEDSLLSAALWSLLIQSAKRERYSYKMEVRDILGPNVSQILKSKGVLHKTKQLLFDCVREITITLPKKDEFMGPEELGRIICQRTKEWGQQGGAGDDTNLTHLLALDYFNSVHEWSKFERHVRDVGVVIADAILESVNDEFVSDLIEFLPTTTVRASQS